MKIITEHFNEPTAAPGDSIGITINDGEIDQAASHPERLQIEYCDFQSFEGAASGGIPSSQYALVDRDFYTEFSARVPILMPSGNCKAELYLRVGTTHAADYKIIAEGLKIVESETPSMDDILPKTITQGSYAVKAKTTRRETITSKTRLQVTKLWYKNQP